MIPKDAKCYAAWHEYEGLVIVHWRQENTIYHDSREGYYFWVGDELCGPWKENGFIRWMDPRGQWHEVIAQSDNTP